MVPAHPGDDSAAVTQVVVHEPLQQSLADADALQVAIIASGSTDIVTVVDNANRRANYAKPSSPRETKQRPLEPKTSDVSSNGSPTSKLSKNQTKKLRKKIKKEAADEAATSTAE